MDFASHVARQLGRLCRLPRIRWNWTILLLLTLVTMASPGQLWYGSKTNQSFVSSISRMRSMRIMSLVNGHDPSRIMSTNEKRGQIWGSLFKRTSSSALVRESITFFQEIRRKNPRRSFWSEIHNFCNFWLTKTKQSCQIGDGQMVALSSREEPNAFTRGDHNC